MKLVAWALIPVLMIGSARAEHVIAGGALALAAIVAQRSPDIDQNDKEVLSRLLDGEGEFTYAPGKMITVEADSIRCRESHVAISDHDCALTFRSDQISLRGRDAHELYATLVEVGVPSDGTAGSSYEALTALSCTIDPIEVQNNGGGGAECTFSPGP